MKLKNRKLHLNNKFKQKNELKPNNKTKYKYHCPQSRAFFGLK